MISPGRTPRAAALPQLEQIGELALLGNSFAPAAPPGLGFYCSLGMGGTDKR